MIESNRLPKLEKLIKNVQYELSSVSQDTSTNRHVIMSMMQLYKLDIAEKRTNDCENMIIQLNYEDANLEALSDVRSYIDMLDSMIIHNTYMYNRILELALSYLDN